MSLNGALQIGRTALGVSQVGIQTTGNNMANAATPGYARRTLQLASAPGDPVGRGQFAGLGVRLVEIRREVDAALQGRLHDSISREQEALAAQNFLASIEQIQNELTENDLSSLLSEFFNAFSELANNPEDNAVRSLVIEQGVSVADRMASLRRDYGVVRDQADAALDDAVIRADALLAEIATVNLEIARNEAGVGTANGLRDTRDSLVAELAQFVDVTVIEQASGTADVFVGSIPIVLAGESRGLEMRTETIDGELEVAVRVKADGSKLNVGSGRIGALLASRDGAIGPAIEDLDALAAQLIFQVNSLHGQGQAATGMSSFESTYTVDDPSLNMNLSDLPFRVENGTMFIHVTHGASGTRTTHQVQLDGDAMTLNDVVDEINVAVGIPNVTASLGPGNRFRLDAAAGYEISFSDDSSGALAALGINTFFSGETAVDIDVNERLRNNPGMLAAGTGHVPGSNGTALAIAALQDKSIDALGGASIREAWQNSVNTLAVQTRTASNNVEAATIVRESLEAQSAGISGVSLDEEAINLLTYQRQFQAAARFIAVIDETLQILLSL